MMLCFADKVKHYSLFTVCIFLNLFVFHGLALAQIASPTVWFEAESQLEDSPYNMFVRMGTFENPVGPTTSIHLDISYTGFSIVSTPVLEADSGWFGYDENYVVEFYIDHNLRRISIDLIRTDGQSVSGAGFLLKGSGFLVVVDDIHFKGPPGQGEQKVEVSASWLPEVWSYWDGNRKNLVLNGLDNQEVQRIDILRLNGDLMLRRDKPSPKLPFEPGAERMIFIRLWTANGVRTQKLLLLDK